MREAGAGARSSRAVVLFSMAGSGARARLVELRAIDAAFPLYGEIGLEAGALAEPAASASGAARSAGRLDRSGAALTARRRGRRPRCESGGRRSACRARSRVTAVARPAASRSHPASTSISTDSTPPGSSQPAAASSISACTGWRRARSPPRSLGRCGARSWTPASRRDPTKRRRAISRAATAPSRATSGSSRWWRCSWRGSARRICSARISVRRVSDLAILVSLGATRTRAQAIFLVQLTLLGLAAAGGAAAYRRAAPATARRDRGRCDAARLRAARRTAQRGDGRGARDAGKQRGVSAADRPSAPAAPRAAVRRTGAARAGERAP